VLGWLNPREERVLRMRFAIGMNTDHALEEIGQQFSVARERIRWPRSPRQGVLRPGYPRLISPKLCRAGWRLCIGLWESSSRSR
jgi:Sigma-70, region 4